MKRMLASLATAIGVLAAQSADAQVSPDARQRSDAHFQEGARLYHAGEYAQSILELKEGYGLAPDPVFLVNIALAYARLENWGEATKFGRRATTEEGLDAEPWAQTGARAEAWSIRGHAESIVAAVGAEPKVAPLVTAVEPTPAKRPGALGWSGIVGAGVGLVSVGAAVVIGATLQDERRAFEDAADAGRQAEFDRLGKTIDNRQRVGQILLYSGAGLIAAGGGLLVFDLLRAESPPKIAITPNGLIARWSW